MRVTAHLFALSLTAACTSAPADDDGNEPAADADFDGYGEDVDCNDLDDQVRPDAVEICDGVDNNCDTVVDEGVTTSYYLDQDDDGYGEQESMQSQLEWTFHDGLPSRQTVRDYGPLRVSRDGPDAQNGYTWSITFANGSNASF